MCDFVVVVFFWWVADRDRSCCYLCVVPCMYGFTVLVPFPWTRKLVCWVVLSVTHIPPVCRWPVAILRPQSADRPGVAGDSFCCPSAKLKQAQLLWMALLAWRIGPKLH